MLAQNGWWVPVLVLGLPPALLVLLILLARLESWMLHPDERAAAVAQLLEQAESAEQVEQEVVKLLSQVTREVRKEPRRQRRARVLRRAATTSGSPGP